jgi:hypothetical protein
MKTKRFIASFTVLAVMFLFMGIHTAEAAGKEKYEESFEKTEALAKDGKVKVKNVSGNITVKTWDRNEVQIDALKVSKASTMDKAQQNAQKVKIEVSREGEILRIETKYPKPSIKNLNVSVDYKLMIPSRASIDAGSVSGDVTVENIGGEAKAHTVSGDVEILRAVNGANGESVSGDVTVMNIDGGAFCKSVSGDIKVNDVTGDADLNTVSGSITVEHLKGSVTAETVSGSVELMDVSDADFVKGKALSGTIIYEGEISSSGRYTLNGHSGTVKMLIPAGSAFDFEASTFSGVIHSDFEIVTSGKISKKKISGSVNGGGADITLKSFSGNIYLKKK